MADYSRRAGRVALAVLALFALDGLAQEAGLIAGQNVNMVSGTVFPGGDPFLQRQNEIALAISTRNEFHLMAGSNDYRTVDLAGLPEGKTVGDSWVSTYFSPDGGGRFDSTLLFGYPQDTSALGMASPIHGFAASADPVVRAGTHGLFYFSGIAFNRGILPESAGFVATFMDLNNDERGNSTGYVRTVTFDENMDGTSFIDKPWIAVDKPRTDAQMVTFDVHLDPDGINPVSQTAKCGNLYVAYARIQGDGTTAVSSDIMFKRSLDCGASFLGDPINPADPIQLSLPNTINQGATVAVEPYTGRVQVAWRQLENATLSCVRGAGFWRNNPEAWPVDEIELAGMLFRKEDGGRPFVPGDDDDSDGDSDSDSDDNDLASRLRKQLLAAWLNSLSGADASDIRETMDAAEAWLLDNPSGTAPNRSVRREGRMLRNILRDFNNGISESPSCDDLPAGGLSGLNPDAIMVTHSDDFGNSFSTPVQVTGMDYFPFEQGTTEFSFRTTGYPSMIFDGDRRSYIAYATRGHADPVGADGDPIAGDSRIVVTTSLDSINWTPGPPIDEPAVPGHQIMPALDFARGQVFLLYYDFRRDLSGVHDRFIVDLAVDPTTPRHSVDVRAAVALAADTPQFTNYSVLDNRPSTQATRYPFLVLNDEFDQPFSQQTKFDLPNLPMFKGGTVPFFGDYIDIATLEFVTDSAGNWQFNTDPARGAPIAHAGWTDNRDVVPSLDGDWTSYVPPGSAGGTSIFDPLQSVGVCTPGFNDDRTQMRNQNVYTSRLTQGLAAAIPGNNRPLGAIQRAFVGFVQNMTDQDKEFRLEILNQPVGGGASFDQFSPVPVPAADKVKDIVIKRNSSISQTIYVTSSNASASVDIRVGEIASGSPVPAGLTALMTINPDATAPQPDADNILSEEIYTPAIFNPAIFNPAIFNQTLLGTGEAGIYSPAIFNPAIFNNPEGDAAFAQAAIQSLALLNPAIFNPAIFNPAIFNPAIFNPAIFNPAIFNPAIFNPAIFNPAIFNPAIFNPAIFNPAIFNPAIFNPAIFNPAIFNPAIFNSSLVETSVLVQNTGNATAAYSLNLDLEDVPAGFVFQLMIYRTYLVPSADGCTLTEQVVQEQLVNEFAPDVQGDLFDPDSTSFYVSPGDNVVVTLRIIPNPDDPLGPGDPSMIDTLAELDLTQSIVPQAVDTPGVIAGETEPTPVISPAPPPSGLTPVFDPVFGAGSVTLDPASGLEWLDLSFTINRSFNNVSANFGAGGAFEGFRYATAAELITLYENAGIGGIDTNVFDAANLDPVSNLLSLTGTTWLGTGSGPFAGGQVADLHPNRAGGHRVSFYQVDNAMTGGRANVLTSGGLNTANDASTVSGSHLVRGPTIDSVVLSTTTLPINGLPAGYTANISNPTSFTPENVVLQGWINQSGASKDAVGTTVSCGGASGDLPPGNCVVNFSLGASNSAADNNVTNNYWIDPVTGAVVFRVTETFTPGSPNNRYEYEVENLTSDLKAKLFRVTNPAGTVTPRTMTVPVFWTERVGAANYIWETANINYMIIPGGTLGGFILEIPGLLPDTTTTPFGWIETETVGTGVRVDRFGAISRNGNLSPGPATAQFDLKMGDTILHSFSVDITLVP